MITERLFFSKLRDMKYISHLDLYRCFQRAIVRSGLDVWYTEGFNSHLYLSFPLALSLGFESSCEVADIRLLSPEEDIPSRLNSCLPQDIRVTDAAEAVMDPGEIAGAEDRPEFDDLELSRQALEEALCGSLSGESIIVQKKTKKGALKEVDIKKDILSFELLQDSQLLTADAVLSAGIQNNLNPKVILDRLSERLGREPDHWLVRRTRLITKYGRDFR